MDPRGTERLDALVAGLYDELRGLASALMQHERTSHTLQPTALAHEAYLRMARQEQHRWQSRAYLMSAAAGVIRRVLVDHARGKQRLKRGAGWDRCDDPLSAPITDLGDVLTLHEALEKLADVHARQARVVELRFFGALEVDEVAQVLGVSPRTVATDWRVAKAWLRARLATPKTED